MRNYPLSEVADIIRGVTFGRTDVTVEPIKGFLPIIRAGNIQKELDLKNDVVYVPNSKVSEEKKIRKGDIVMCTSSGSSTLVGKCAISEINWDGSFGAFCVGIRAKKEKCDALYLLHFLRSPKFSNWTMLSSGANIKNIRKSELEAFQIPLPTLNDQKRIATILEKADDICRKRQQTFQLVDKFLRAVFLDIFGDPVTNPKGWIVRRLEDVASIQIGPFGTQLHKEDYIVGGIPLINPTHIVNGVIVPNDNLTIASEKFESLPQYHLAKGDIVMGRRGEMGRCALIGEREHGWMSGTGSLFIRPRLPGVISEYLHTLLSSKAVKSYLESESLGATMPNLNKAIVGSIKVPVPDEKSMNKYQSAREKILNVKRFQQAANENRLFESFSQKAFMGEL